MINDIGLQLHGSLPVHAFGAGMLIAREGRRHVDRVANHFVLIFVREGVLPIQEEEKAFEVKAGQSLLLWPARRHWGTADFSPDLRFFWLHFFLELSPGAGEPLIVPQYTT